MDRLGLGDVIEFVRGCISVSYTERGFLISYSNSFEYLFEGMGRPRLPLRVLAW